jgi:radical SAM protein with 4Fe4S-binding SPASM domain
MKNTVVKLNRKKIKSTFKILFFRNYFLKKIEKKFKIPGTLYIEGTNLCNAKCVFCYYPIIADQIVTKHMSLDQFKNIVKQFVDMGGSNLSITPTMSDPLADPLLPERIEYLKNSGIQSLSFYTNLISFKQKIRATLVNLGDTLKVKINVSFTGFNQESYNKFMGVNKFDFVKKNLIKLSESSSKNESLSSSVTMRDYDGSGEEKLKFLQYLKDINMASKIEYGFDTWGGLLEDNISKFEQLPVKERIDRVGPCKVSFAKPLITVNGDFKLCDCRDALDELVVGNVFEHTIEEIWHGDNIKNMRNRFYSDKTMPDVCLKCEYYQSIYR